MIRCDAHPESLAWLIAALVGAGLVALVLLDAAAPGYGSGRLESAAFVLAAFASTAVGLLLALRRPANPIGWLLLGNAVALVLAGIAEVYPGYALDRDGSHPGARLAAAWNTWGWPTLFAPLVAIALLFPDGRLPSPRWRPAALAGLFCFVIVLVTGMLWDEPLDSPYESFAPYAVLPDAVGSHCTGSACSA